MNGEAPAAWRPCGARIQTPIGPGKTAKRTAWKSAAKSESVYIEKER